MKISDFGLKKCVEFPKLKSNRQGNSRSQQDENNAHFPGSPNLLHKMSALGIKGNPPTRSFNFDDGEGASFMSPTDTTVDPIEIAQVSTSTARDNLKDSSSHPGIWMLAGSWSEFTDQDGNVLIQVNPTVHGDVFAAGCLFFYFLPTPTKRGLHPFGDAAETILDNILRKKNPINLNRKVNSNYIRNRNTINFMFQN